MSKKNDYKKAWDRFIEEVDISEIDNTNELIENFFDWINPNSGKEKGLSEFENYILNKFEEYINTLPTYEQLWIKEISPNIPSQYKETAKEWYNKILTAKNQRQAFEYFYRMPTKLFKALPHETIKELREKILSYFL